MTSNVKEYILANINKFITFILTIIFVISFFSYKGLNVLTICTTIVLIGLNVANIYIGDIRKNIKTSILIQFIIYEIIGLLGIYYLDFFYILVFILIYQLFRTINNRLLLYIVIGVNSSIYLYTAIAKPQLGMSLWQAFLLLFLSLALSIYLINNTVDTNENNEIIDGMIIEKQNIEKKYSELLQEHQNVLILKKIMELSNNTSDLNIIIIRINELINKFFDDIDYSTILLFDERRKEFKIAATNIPTQFHNDIRHIDQFDIFDDVINNVYGKSLSSENGLNYPTASQRNVNSALCLPLHTNKNLIGLMLLESENPSLIKTVDIKQFTLIRYNISLIIENKNWIDKIEKMALQDGLTGVYNRNYLFDFLESQFKSHKETGKELCLAMMDIDHFKKFNDTYGHLFGDLVLKELSNLIKNSIREEDVIARYGGEEFIIIFVDTNVEQGFKRTDEIRQKIERYLVKNEEGVSANVTASFGIAEFNKFSYNITMQQLIERADKALYQSKDTGRNKVTIFN